MGRRNQEASRTARSDHVGVCYEQSLVVSDVSNEYAEAGEWAEQEWVGQIEVLSSNGASDSDIDM